MSDEKKAIDKTLGITSDATDKFTDGVEVTQRAILGRINSAMRALEIKSGLIVINRANLAVLRRLRGDITGLVINDAYKKKLDTFLGSFAKIKGANDSYFSSILSDFNPSKQVFGDILKGQLALTQESLLEAGIMAEVVNPIVNLVQQGITSGMAIGDMEDALRLEIVGGTTQGTAAAPRLGRMERYTKQITRDALNQFSRNYGLTVSREYGMEWYYYDGSVIDDTRDYCRKRAGKYFHKKEVEKSAKKRWSGKIPNTTASSIFVYCGGYNCRHEYMPVLINVIPTNVINKNLRNGNYDPV